MKIESSNLKSKKLDIIWNITSICPWDCAICCVDAKHVTVDKQSGTILIADSLGHEK